MNNIKELEIKCREVIKQNIADKDDKAMRDLVRNLWPLLIKYNISFDKFKEDYDNDIIIDCSFLDEPGSHDWLDYVSEEYKELAKELFELRPVGLGTPNAAVGEGEYMMFALSKYCNKPSKGDVKYKNSIKEFKNDKPRFYSRVQGKRFRLNTVEIAEKFGLEPNINRSRVEGVEITESSRKSHWDAQLGKISLKDRYKFLQEWLEATEAFTNEEAISSSKRIIKDGYIDENQLQIEICKYFFKSSDNLIGDNLIMFNGPKLINVKFTFSEIERMFDNGSLVPCGNYFRINQDANIGWYYKYNN